MDKQRGCDADEAGYKKNRPHLFAKIILRLDYHGMQQSDEQKHTDTDQNAI